MTVFLVKKKISILYLFRFIFRLQLETKSRAANLAKMVIILFTYVAHIFFYNRIIDIQCLPELLTVSLKNL